MVPRGRIELPTLRFSVVFRLTIGLHARLHDGGKYDQSDPYRDWSSLRASSTSQFSTKRSIHDCLFQPPEICIYLGMGFLKGLDFLLHRLQMCHDAALFIEGWERDERLSEVLRVITCLAYPFVTSFCEEPLLPQSIQGKR